MIIATRIGGLGANILQVDRRLFLDVPAKGAKLDVTLETRDAAHAEEIWRRSPPTAMRRCGLSRRRNRCDGVSNQAADCAGMSGSRSCWTTGRSVHGQEVVAGLDHLVAALVEGRRAGARAGLSRFKEEDGPAACDRLLRAFKCLNSMPWRSS